MPGLRAASARVRESLKRGDRPGVGSSVLQESLQVRTWSASVLGKQIYAPGEMAPTSPLGHHLVSESFIPENGQLVVTGCFHEAKLK